MRVMWDGTDLRISAGDEVEILRGIPVDSNEVRATVLRNLTTGVRFRSRIEGVTMSRGPSDLNPSIRGYVRSIEVTNNTNFEVDQTPPASRTIPPPQQVGHTAETWDLFICHAGEDKEAVARPLAEILTKMGFKVWFDAFTLTLGDSLSSSIDNGLANSKFGVVILSPSFFNKRWPRRELDGLTAREISSGKTILPVWHKVDHDFIVRFSPMLADKLAVSTDEGQEKVANEIAKALKRSG